MPTDLTAFFKARCKILSQKKLKGEALTVQSTDHPSLSYRSLARIATKIAQEIYDFSHAVLSKRRDYLDFNASMALMTDDDRDTFDKDTERGLRSMAELIFDLLQKISKDKNLYEQEKEHLLAVCTLLEMEIKKIGRVTTEMRRLHITAVANRRGMRRLSTLVAARDRKNKIATPNITASPEPGQVRRRGATTITSDEKKHELQLNDAKDMNSVALMEENTEEQHLDLTPIEKAQLQEENDKLFKKYTNAQDTVNTLESQIFEIQRLQETFADKVFDQEKEIDILNEVAVSTTENIRDGNEWIRQAISNSAGRRVVLLFCIVVLTFTLLFLHWYNP